MKTELLWKQSNDEENLAACFASLALYYKCNIPFYRIVQALSVSENPEYISNISVKLEQLGFKAKEISSSWNVKSISWPLLARYANEGEKERFVVIYRKRLQTITIMDPLTGDFRKIKNVDFEKYYKGLLIFIIPVDTIEKYKKASNLERFGYLFKTNKAGLLQSFAGAIAETILGLATVVYVLKIIDYVLTDGNTNLLNLMSVAMLVFLALRIILNVCRKLITLKIEVNIDAGLTLAYFKQILSLPKPFYNTNRNGEITSRIYDVNEVSSFVTTVMQQIILNILFVSFSVFFMFIYSWKLALTVFFSLSLYYCLHALYKKASKAYFREYKVNYSDFFAHFTESLSSVDTIKSFLGIRYFGDVAEKKYFSFLKTKYKISVINIILENGTEFISGITIVIIMWLGAGLVIQHTITPGTLISFYALLGYLFSPAKSLVNSNYFAQLALIATDRLFEIMETDTEEKNKAAVILPKGYKGDIQLNDVKFHHTSSKTLFNNFNLTVAVGKTTAMVGESGSGKTTLISLIQGLYVPYEGSISIGSYNLANVDLTSLRNLIGVVPQKVDLFTGSIVENIALGAINPDMRKIVDLCRLLGIKDFIENLPQGYHTQVGEQGAMLSGGEKQRIAIARALYRDPEILIFDEATSSLDSASESYVKRVLQMLRRKGKTIIIIAHRLSTIMDADNIVVLKHGKMVEKGDHNQLMQKKRHYFHMWQYQYPHTESIELHSLVKRLDSRQTSHAKTDDKIAYHGNS
jgi:ATP-binding cassette subfamily B protein